MKKYFFALLFVAQFGFSQITEIKVRETQTIDVAPPKAEMEEEAEVPFGVIEQIPVFKGCENVEKEQQRECLNYQMQKHILKNLRYPEEATEKGISGRVYVLFIIDKEGNVTNVKARGPKIEGGAILEDEAIRIIKLLPQFKPGMQRGKPVNVRYTIPISFNSI